MQTSAHPSPLQALAERVAMLNPDAARIGAGMLAQLVTEARNALGGTTPAKEPTVQTFDLLEIALDDCARRQAHERRMLAARAPEFAGIEDTLQALHGAGLLLTRHSIQILPRGFDEGARNQILVTAHAAQLARNVGTHRLIAAGFRQLFGTGSTNADVWQHASSGWALMITWSTAGAFIDAEGVAA